MSYNSPIILEIMQLKRDFRGDNLQDPEPKFIFVPQNRWQELCREVPDEWAQRCTEHGRIFGMQIHLTMNTKGRDEAPIHVL